MMTMCKCGIFLSVVGELGGGVSSDQFREDSAVLVPFDVTMQ